MSAPHSWSSLIAAGARRGWDRLRDIPPIRQVRHQAHLAEFRMGRPNNGVSGVYPDFDTARRAAPGSTVGYDHNSQTQLEISGFRAGEDPSFGPMDSSEYPLLFWLAPLIEDGIRVFDFGGYLGNGFYLYRDYIDYPPSLSWTVCDVPAVARAGAALAERRGETQLHFTTEPTDLAEADLLIAAGSLQYLEDGFLQKLLADLPRRPKHLFIHRTPMHPERGFVTLQTWHDGSRPVFCPYTIPHRDSFVAGLTGLGYRLIDSWDKARPLDVPLHPECRVETYSGMYLRLDEPGPAS